MASRAPYAFEGIDDTLDFMPLAARRVLDVLGRKLALQGWRSLSDDDRRMLLLAGTGEQVDPAAAAVVDRARPAAAAVDAMGDPDPSSPPDALVSALGAARPVDAARWRGLRAL